MIAAAAALAAGQGMLTHAREQMLIDALERVAGEVDRVISVELTAIAIRADDLVAARRAGGPTWFAQDALRRSVHLYFMRSLADMGSPESAGQGVRDAG